ncbi:hypothetical protein GX48_03194 [Paracoccidioides brasiliensis]|nr:hypothetical protein GX48_03194 [Paracoccidioides brasiliensis]
MDEGWLGTSAVLNLSHGTRTLSRYLLTSTTCGQGLLATYASSPRSTLNNDITENQTGVTTLECLEVQQNRVLHGVHLQSCGTWKRLSQVLVNDILAILLHQRAHLKSVRKRYHKSRQDGPGTTEDRMRARCKVTHIWG